MSEPDLRKQFEVWAHGRVPLTTATLGNSSESYTEPQTCRAWSIWQAAYQAGYAAGSTDMREKAAEMAGSIHDSMVCIGPGHEREGRTCSRCALAAAIRSLPGSPKEEK